MNPNISNNFSKEQTFSEGINLNNTYIKGVADPEENSDAATKNYVDTLVADIPVEKGTGVGSVIQKGGGNIASGDYSFAEGHGTIALGENSHTEGSGHMHISSFTITGKAGATVYTTSNAHYLRINTIVMYNNVYRKITNISSTRSFVVDSTLSSDDLSGVNIYICHGVACGKNSHSEGYNTKALGNHAHAEGYYTGASDFASHAEGQNTTASGYSSHSEGSSTTASGSYSHAEGNTTTASGYSSHSEGQNTTASGYCSHAEGEYTTASGRCSHAEGTYNYDDDSFIHMTGVGEDDDSRLNALSITDRGKVYVKDVGGYVGQQPTGNDLKTHLDSTDLTDHEIDYIFAIGQDIYSIYMDKLREYDPDWYKGFGVNDKYEFVDALITDGEVAGPSDSFNIRNSHRFMNTDQSLTYEGINYQIFADVNGDDLDYLGPGSTHSYRMLINPDVDTYAAISKHQLYGSNTSAGKYRFTMLDPDTQELYEGEPNMWSRQYVFYVESTSN